MTTDCPARRKHDGEHCRRGFGHLGAHRYPENDRYQRAADTHARYVADRAAWWRTKGGDAYRMGHPIDHADYAPPADRSAFRAG